jgi:hypothetical protein
MGDIKHHNQFQTTNEYYAFNIDKIIHDNTARKRITQEVKTKMIEELNK